MGKDWKTLPRERKLLYGGAIVVVIIGLWVFYGARQKQAEEALLSPEAISSVSVTAGGGEVMVHIVGAVISPGVYTLPANARLIDAVEAAGGLTEDADQTTVNLAAVVKDGEKITIRTVEEVSADVTNSGTVGGLVNINTASREELMTLPGIGEVLADNIIAYRTKNGGFSSVEELTEVNRIGDKLLENLRERITL